MKRKISHTTYNVAENKKKFYYNFNALITHNNIKKLKNGILLSSKTYALLQINTTDTPWKSQQIIYFKMSSHVKHGVYHKQKYLNYLSKMVFGMSTKCNFYSNLPKLAQPITKYRLHLDSDPN